MESTEQKTKEQAKMNKRMHFVEYRRAGGTQEIHGGGDNCKQLLFGEQHITVRREITRNWNYITENYTT